MSATSSSRPIVVGVDASPTAPVAARNATALSTGMGAPLALVHATPDAWSIPTAPMSLPLKPEEINEAARQAARATVVAELGDELPADLLEALQVRTGRAATVVRDVVDEMDAQLVVLGGKHHSALGRWVVGSTAHSLVRTLDVPLFVCAEGHIPVRRIVVAVDLSEAAGPTVKAAVRFARVFGAALHVLHVVEPLPIIPETPLTFNDDDVHEEAERHLERYIWPDIDYESATMSLRRGAAAETIDEEARERAADLVVLGSHGKGWVDRILIGSVTERVLSALPTSVLVVPVLGPADRRSRASGRHDGRSGLTLEA